MNIHPKQIKHYHNSDSYSLNYDIYAFGKQYPNSGIGNDDYDLHQVDYELNRSSWGANGMSSLIHNTGPLHKRRTRLDVRNVKEFAEALKEIEKSLNGG